MKFLFFAYLIFGYGLFLFRCSNFCKNKINEHRLLDSICYSPLENYGTYPNTIYTDENGILKLEIGGSSKYTIRRTGEIKTQDIEETGFSGVIADITEETHSVQTETSNSKSRLNTSTKIIIVAVLAVILGIVSRLCLTT